MCTLFFLIFYSIATTLGRTRSGLHMSEVFYLADFFDMGIIYTQDKIWTVQQPRSQNQRTGGGGIAVSEGAH